MQKSIPKYFKFYLGCFIHVWGFTIAHSKPKAWYELCLGSKNTSHESGQVTNIMACSHLSIDQDITGMQIMMHNIIEVQKHQCI